MRRRRRWTRGEAVPQSISDQVREGYRCWWCARRLQGSSSPNPSARTREHVVPRSRGGPTNARNIRQACRECNHARGDDTRWVPWVQHGGHMVDAMPVSQWLVLCRIPDRIVQGRGRAEKAGAK